MPHTREARPKEDGVANGSPEDENRRIERKRKLLSDQFARNPGNTRLALELKLIDDQIAECNVQIQLDRRKRK